MTPRTVKPLAVTPGNGTGPASTSQLVQTQNAILTSNATVLGAVTQMQTDIGQRLDRQFGETAASIQIVEGKVDGLDDRLGCLETARRDEALLAAERADVAAKAETSHAAKAAIERADAKDTATSNNADRAAHSLSRNQRMAITVAAVSAAATLLLSSGFAGLIANVARFLSGG